jgi:electron transfer flavoprotein beta subunit
MLVVVCIKQVPDTTLVKIDPVTNTLIREGIPNIMNPFDIHALEEALRLKDSFGVRVAVVTMGPPNAEKTLRYALALGADEAILCSDRAFGGADTLATSNVLSAVVKKLGLADRLTLVLCGRQTIDGDTAQVGPGIATRLGLSQLTLVDRIEKFDPEGGLIRVRRKLEGRREIVESGLPAVMTVVREINQPRYPTVPARLASLESPVILWDNSVLGLPVTEIGLKGSPTHVKKIFSPERAKSEILGDGQADPAGTAALLVEKLAAKSLITA